MSDREQYVCTNDLKTERLSVKTGVLQGSALGPFFFLIYMHDLLDVSDRAEKPMLADDTTLFQSGKETQCLLSSEMKPDCEMFLLNKLTINPAKCEAMCFGRGRPEKINIGSAELNHKTSR